MEEALFCQAGHWQTPTQAFRQPIGWVCPLKKRVHWELCGSSAQTASFSLSFCQVSYIIIDNNKCPNICVKCNLKSLIYIHELFSSCIVSAYFFLLTIMMHWGLNADLRDSGCLTLLFAFFFFFFSDVTKCQKLLNTCVASGLQGAELLTY